MTENTTKFLLTMPVEVKEAARSLLRLYQSELELEAPDTLNELFVGMIEQNINDKRENLARWDKKLREPSEYSIGLQKIIAFFVSNPGRTDCNVSDVLDSKEAMRYIALRNQEFQSDLPSKPDERQLSLSVSYKEAIKNYIEERTCLEVRAECIEKLKAYFAWIDEGQRVSGEEIDKARLRFPIRF